MTVRALLGIDDTDVLGHKPGTGRLARELAAALSTPRVRMSAVVRHQLLVDPRVPYTSHNSPACVVFDLDDPTDADGVFDRAADYVGDRSALGSDPGVCLALADEIGDDVVDWGLRAGAEVLDKRSAFVLAARSKTRLRELGGSGDGVIGALAAVGLTRYGNAGRFLDLGGGGLRELDDPIDAEKLLKRGITLVSSARNSEPVPPTASISTGDWLRPRLIGGRPVLLVEPAEDGWRCSDRKKPKADAEPTTDR